MMAKASDKVTVDRVEITVGKKKLSLTTDELRELRDVLDATFPKVIPYKAPIVIERPIYIKDLDPWRDWRTTWTSNEGHKATNGTLCISSKA